MGLEFMNRHLARLVRPSSFHGYKLCSCNDKLKIMVEFHSLDAVWYNPSFIEHHTEPLSPFYPITQLHIVYYLWILRFWSSHEQHLPSFSLLKLLRLCRRCHMKKYLGITNRYHLLDICSQSTRWTIRTKRYCPWPHTWINRTTSRFFHCLPSEKYTNRCTCK
jgi:hypothetical protein